MVNLTERYVINTAVQLCSFLECIFVLFCQLDCDDFGDRDKAIVLPLVAGLMLMESWQWELKCL